MKKLVFHGDGLLCPPDGYGEAMVELLVLERPEAAIRSYHPGEEKLRVEEALRAAPALIGKAPDFIHLGVGSVDLLEGVAPETALEALKALVQLLVLKTQAVVSVATLIPAFLPPEARPAAEAFNAGLAALAAERVRVTDLDTPVRAFLDAHRRAAGEKRSLHAQPLKPTSMGRAFLARAAYVRSGLETLA